jgi:hypothetical protein
MGEILAALSMDVARISEDAKKNPAQFARDVKTKEGGCRRKDSLRFSPTEREWESEGCASACDIFRGDLPIESNGSSTKAYATLPLTTLSTHKSNQPQNV